MKIVVRMIIEFICETKDTLSGDFVLDNSYFRVESKDPSWKFNPNEEYRVKIEKL